MPLIRKRRVYAADAYHPQKNLSNYLRMGYIAAVNVEAGSCSVNWLDSSGGRSDVALTQGAWGEYSMPIPGTYVFVMFDLHDQARIVRYANLNQFFDQQSIADGGTNLVQKLQAGDKFWHSSGNAYLYMNSVGRVVLADAEGDMLEIDADANLFKVTTVNWKVVSNAGSEYAGDVKRPGTSSPFETVTDNVPTPTFPGGTPLEEATLQINDFNPNNKPTGLTTININLGTYVDPTGLIPDVHGIPTTASSPTALAVRINVSAPAGNATITIDKKGTIQVTAPEMVLNCSDIRLGSEFVTEPGVLGNKLVTILQNLISKFNSHIHSGVTPGGGTSGTSVVTDQDNPSSVIATAVKLQ